MVQISSLRGTDFFFCGTDFLPPWDRFLLLWYRFPLSMGQISSFVVQISSLRGTDFLLLWYRFPPSVGQIFFFCGTDFLPPWDRFSSFMVQIFSLRGTDFSFSGIDFPLLRYRFPSSVGQIPSFCGTFCDNLILAPFGVRCARKLGAAYAILRVG